MNIDKTIENLGGIVPLYPKKQTYPNEEYWAKVNTEYQHLITY